MSQGSEVTIRGSGEGVLVNKFQAVHEPLGLVSAPEGTREFARASMQ